MYLKNPIKIIHALAFRLTVLYAGIFILTFVGSIIFFFIYANINRYQSENQDYLNEVKDLSFILVLKGVENFKTAIVIQSGDDKTEKAFYSLIPGDGAEIGSPNLSSWRFLSDEASLKRFNSGPDYLFENLPAPNISKTSIRYGFLDKDKLIHPRLPSSADEQFLMTFKNRIGIPFVIIVIFAGLVGWAMAKRALSGLDEVTRTATAISRNDDFNCRVPIKGKCDEIDRLAITFNNMLQHIQELIKEMREMTDNIAHDLRSPIARIRGIAEMTMITAKSSADYDLMIGSVIEECDQLLDTIKMMLDISEAEAGISKLNKSEINCSILLKKSCELFKPIIDDKGIKMVLDLREDVTVYADNKKLQRVVANLLDNAIKYSHTEGTISISIMRDEKNVSISITDNGLGISPQDLPHIFERFYRCDSSRSNIGNGLGLCWSMAIIKAHNGSISVSSKLNEGGTFTITIPQR